jgi:hypothetical protein
VATRLLREHQWAPQTVLAEGHRPVCLPPGTTRCDRQSAQPAATGYPRLLSADQRLPGPVGSSQPTQRFRSLTGVALGAGFHQAISRLKYSVSVIVTSTPSSITYNYPGRLKFVEVSNEIRERLITDPDLSGAMLSDKKKLAGWKRTHLYELGAVSSMLAVYLWTKRSVVADIGELLVESLKGTSFLLPFILVRPILEHAGNLILFSKKRDELKLVELNKPKDKEYLLIDYSALLARSGKATRIEWGTMMTTPIDIGKTKSFKPGLAELDVTAEGLMQGIDQLDKKIKGARKAYDLASEFAHPNVGPHQIFIREAKSTKIDEYVTLSHPQ